MVSSFISQWPWKSDCLLKYGNMCIVLLYSLLSDNSQLSPGRFPFLNCKNVILIDTFNAVGLHFERNPKKRFSGVCRLSWSVGKSNVQFYCLALLLKRGCLKTRINYDRPNTSTDSYPYIGAFRTRQQVMHLFAWGKICARLPRIGSLISGPPLLVDFSSNRSASATAGQEQKINRNRE